MLSSKSLFALALVSAVLQASPALAHDSHDDHHDHDSKSCSTEVVKSKTGPANYHALYNNISSTLVTIQDFNLRTNDGQTIHVKSNPVEIDLQDLNGTGKGFVIDLTQVTFPNNAPTVDVVEVRAQIVDQSHARAVISATGDCPLSVPKTIDFYTTAPVTVIQGQSYRVGVTYSPLNSIEVTVETTTLKKKCSAYHKSCKQKVDSTPSTKQICRLENRRQLINKFLRPQDEF